MIWIWMGRRAKRAGGHWEIFGGARFGAYPASLGASVGGDPTYMRSRVWVHAVSLGETRAAQPLLQAILDNGHDVLLTHTTATGRAEGARLFAQFLASGRMVQTWLPYDFPGSMRRFFIHFDPTVGILIEREVWPNLLHEAHRRRVPMALVSARFSSSSLRQASRFSSLFRPAYGSFGLVATQTEADAERLRSAGAREPLVLGNLKFDVSLSGDQLDAGRVWRRRLGRPIVCIASTREGEEPQFVSSLALRDTQGRREADADALHVLIPRHPQRFDEVAALLSASGLRYVRRSEAGADIPTGTQVLLGDTLGELAYFYAASDVAIVGGGFAPLGGQNLIEACVAGAPVIVGPHMFNFSQATHDAVDAGAAVQVPDPGAALSLAWTLLRDTERRREMRLAAEKWTARYNGATRKIMQALLPWLKADGASENGGEASAKQLR